jgi:6-phosphogluconolactonase
MSVSIEIVEDPARVCADLMIEACASRGCTRIVLAGGSTPKRANELFAASVRERQLSLGDVAFWLGDDRAVGPDDPNSNYRMVRETLLEPLADMTAPLMHRIEGELGYAVAADHYEEALRHSCIGHFDLLLLGIGPDGHTLSLFPGKPALLERDRLVVGVPEAGMEPFVPRVSFTLSAVALARHVVFLTEGAGKAQALTRAFGPDAVPDPAVPSSLIATVADNVTLLCDAAAAVGLKATATS